MKCSMKIGFAGKRRTNERGEYQNGSRDISYLIKLDCEYFLIGLKLYDHDDQI